MEPHMDRQDDATTTEPAPPSDWPALAKAFRAREVQDLGPLVRRVTARTAGMMTAGAWSGWRWVSRIWRIGPRAAASMRCTWSASAGPGSITTTSWRPMR